MSVPCLYPDPEIVENLPDGWEEFKDGDTCLHLYCREAEYYRQLYRAQPVETKDERESRLADTELMRDEFHGRDD